MRKPVTITTSDGLTVVIIRCCDCKRILPTTDFGGRSDSPHGRSYRCKQCDRDRAFLESWKDRLARFGFDHARDHLGRQVRRVALLDYLIRHPAATYQEAIRNA